MPETGQHNSYRRPATAAVADDDTERRTDPSTPAR